MAGGLYHRERVTAADALPAYEILNSVRSLGLRPSTQALRRGPWRLEPDLSDAQVRRQAGTG
jgi:hypothetical protein